MAYALYDEKIGYYTHQTHIFGERGDFITAPTLSPLFSKALAQQVAEVLRALPKADVLELGPGTGIMAAHILQTLAQLDALPEHYYLIEISDVLKKRQRETILSICPELLPLCEWIPAIPHAPFRGVILGNEFLDALPVDRFLFENGQFLQSQVHSENGHWHESFVSSQDPKFMAAIQSVVEELPETLPEAYLSEVSSAVRETVAKLAAQLDEGLMLFIDYGFGVQEYYHPDRNEGTVMCHYKQTAHANPFINVGEQDITAHVNFTEVAKVAVENGCLISGYNTQADFLIALGILEQHSSEDVKENILQAQALKKLLMPHEMGELFKVIALSKNFAHALVGFSKDLSHRL